MWCPQRKRHHDIDISFVVSALENLDRIRYRLFLSGQSGRSLCGNSSFRFRGLFIVCLVLGGQRGRQQSDQCHESVFFSGWCSFGNAWLVEQV